jgi:hypothetical protein
LACARVSSSSETTYIGPAPWRTRFACSTSASENGEIDVQPCALMKLRAAAAAHGARRHTRYG